MKRTSHMLLLPLAIWIAGCGSNKPAGVTTPSAPRNGLVAEYTFSGNARDGSGNANDGVLSGGPAPTKDRFGTADAAYILDGVDDVITTANDQFAAGNDISVSVWFNVASTATGLNYFVMCSDFGVWINGASAGIAISTPATNSAYGTFATPGVWHHLLGTYDGTDIRCYLDGALVQTTNHPGNISDENRPLTFGVFVADYWAGALDDVRIYNRVISDPAEISALYHERGYAQ